MKRSFDIYYKSAALGAREQTEGQLVSHRGTEGTELFLGGTVNRRLTGNLFSIRIMRTTRMSANIEHPTSNVQRRIFNKAHCRDSVNHSTNVESEAVISQSRNKAIVTGKAILFAVALLFTSSVTASTHELLTGDVKITLESTPDKVVPSADLMLTVTIDSPTYLKVVLPDLRTRFSGFSLADDFASDPVEAGGRKRQTYRWRLVPEPAASKYRLAPFAVATLDQRVSPPRSQTFATKPVIFSGEGPRPSVTGDPEVILKPDWIPPTAKTVTLWILFVILGFVAFAAIVYGLMQISRRVKEYKMSPIERAMAELHRLLNRNLPGKGLYKDFYIELTMVVRRYIERTHGIHAPEQTTQEFLFAAAKHPLFKREVLIQLRTFLESADLVKFAGQEATIDMADDATQKAKRYIEDDSHHADTPSSSKVPLSNG